MNLHKIQSDFGLLPDTDRAHGIDLAYYEEPFNPETATGTIDFGFQKITQGVNIVDPALDSIWTGTSKLAVRGGYHYITTAASGKDQAAFFFKHLGTRSVHFLIGDVEKYANDLGDPFTAEGQAKNDKYVRIVYDFLTELNVKANGRRVLLYTNPDVYDTIIYPGAIRIWGKDVFKQWDLWTAQYYFVINPNSTPFVSRYRKDWKFYQYTEKGAPDVYGTGGYVDLDVFNGTLTELLTFANATTDPVPPTPLPEPDVVPETTLFDALVLAGMTMIVRTFPQVNNETRTDYRLVGGEKVSGFIWVGNGYVWLKIADSSREGLVGKWVAVRGVTGFPKYITLHLAPIVSTADIREVKTDPDMWSWDYRIRDVIMAVGNAPAVNRTGPIDNPDNMIRGKLTREWQFFWVDLLSMRVYSKLYNQLDTTQRKKMADLVTVLGGKNLFLTNRFGMDNCNNYVTGDIRDEEPKVDPLICAGSKVRVLETRTSTGGITTGLEMARLWSFKQNETPPVVTADLLHNDQRILRATVLYKDGHLEDFPQLYQKFPGLDSYWVPYPYISVEDCWFPADDLTKA